MDRQVRAALLCAVLLIIVAGCGSKAPVELKMAPLSALPPEIQRAPVAVREAYQFAIANKEILQEIPCFCGCVDVGHQNNYMCYVKEDGSSNGDLVLDSHAYG